MAISKTFIARLALSALGNKSRIENVDTENSVEAKECKLWYDFAREEALEAFDWSFARKRATLAEHSVDPPEEWAYRYQYPADCLAMRFIENPAGPTADPVPYIVEDASDGTPSILANLDSAVAVYTFNQQNTTRFSRHFCRTMAYFLARDIAIALTGKRTLRDDMVAAAATMIVGASAQNSNERQDPKPRDAEYIRAREGL